MLFKYTYHRLIHSSTLDRHPYLPSINPHTPLRPPSFLQRHIGIFRRWIAHDGTRNTLRRSTVRFHLQPEHDHGTSRSRQHPHHRWHTAMAHNQQGTIIPTYNVL